MNPGFAMDFVTPGESAILFTLSQRFPLVVSPQVTQRSVVRRAGLFFFAHACVFYAWQARGRARAPTNRYVLFRLELGEWLRVLGSLAVYQGWERSDLPFRIDGMGSVEPETLPWNGGTSDG